MAANWKVLVISDTHERLDRAVGVIKAFDKSIDAVYHLGDHLRDASRLQAMFPEIPVVGIAGNCDYSMVENEKVLEILGHRIYMCHGHQYGVKRSYTTLIGYGKRNHYDVVLCGHTHEAYVQDTPGLLLLNPGSIGEPRLISGASYAVLYLEEGVPPQYCFGYTKEPVDAVKRFLETRN